MKLGQNQLIISAILCAAAQESTFVELKSLVFMVSTNLLDFIIQIKLKRLLLFTVSFSLANISVCLFFIEQAQAGRQFTSIQTIQTTLSTKKKNTTIFLNLIHQINILYTVMNKVRKLFIPIVLPFITYKYACQQTQTTSATAQSRPIKFKTRKDHIQQITTNPNYDVVIIGGGCNGVGVMLDASTRGMRTLLIEKDDFASGTSSKSTKLIHGGVRYLQQCFEFSTASISSRMQKFKLVKEAIIERSLMLDSAPHLTTKIPFIIPCTNIFQAAYYYIGSFVYYLIYHHYAPKTATKFNFPYFVNREELTSIFPNMAAKFNTGVVYEDGSFNDSRLLLSALLTATLGNGIKMPKSFVPANALNKAQFLDFIKDERGKITGVVMRDSLSKKQYKINAKYVVNCTGTWADTIRLKDNPKAKKRICVVGGSHITYDNRVASKSFGICAPSPDGRIILVVPWLNRVIAGTTERKFDEPTNNPLCSQQQRNFINTTFYDLMNNLDVGTFMSYERTRWCGLRPLVTDDAESQTKNIARNHVVEVSESGLYSLMGGKWTTYRKMGEDVMNKICEQEKNQGKEYPSTQTIGLPLIGSSSAEIKNALFKQKKDIGVQLYNNFGSFATEIAKGNLSRVYGSTTRAQIQWIVKNQLVNDIDDVLLRRTRLCFLISKMDVLKLASVVGEIMQKEWGWTSKERDRIVRESMDRILSYEFQ